MIQNKKYKSIPLNQIEELTAIYDDYLYISRQQERIINTSSLEELEYAQKERMNPERPDMALSWHISALKNQEKQEFKDFIDDDINNDGTHSYVTLQHVKTEEDRGFIKKYAIPPYRLTYLNMQLPSTLERCTIAYPADCKLGDTTFFIDGMYKAVYTGKLKDAQLSDIVRDMDLLNELYMVISYLEYLDKNNYVGMDNFVKSLRDICAAERVVANENIILECLGSFAAKVLDMCRETYIGHKTKYTKQENRLALDTAEQEGLIKSADAFQEYVNIRHFLRHQWDTLDDLGYFTPGGAKENKNTRQEYVASYLKLCDKSIVQRMKSYIDVLHQLQHVINILNPNRIIRYNDESNNKFIDRVLTAHFVNVENGIDTQIYAELNYPLVDKKYKTLNQRLHYKVPVVNVVDEYPDDSYRYEQINYHVLRSYFLQSFTSVECMVMRHCQIRGQNMKKQEAWEYLEKIGFHSPAEAKKWRHYSHLRNVLSHNYYSDRLRQKLCDQEKEYDQDLKILADKLWDNGPDVIKLRPGVYEYTHSDGLVVRLDYNQHKVLYVGNVETDTKNSDKPTPDIKPIAFKNGIDFQISGKQITSVSLPSGITVNMNDGGIDFGSVAHLNTNTDNFSILRTSNSKMVLDTGYRVTEYKESKKPVPFRNGDNWRIDNKHQISLDTNCRIKEIKFKTPENQILRVVFDYSVMGCKLMFLNDGTMILSRGQEVAIRHNGKTLTFDTRQEFADTYTKKAMQQKTNTR